VKDEWIGRLFELIRAEQEDVQAFDHAAAELLGINLTDLRVLGILERMGPVSASGLAAAAGLTSGSLTALGDRLEATGYVRRVRDESDRRRVFIELTERAIARTGAIWGPLGEEAYGWASRYSEEELEFLVNHFIQAREFLGRHRERIARMTPEELDGPRPEDPGEMDMPKDRTTETGFQVGVQRTLDADLETAWEWLTSLAGVRTWLGHVEDLRWEEGAQLKLADGARAAVRIFRPGEWLRVTWQPKQWTRPATIQIRVKAKGERTLVSFDEEGLPSQEERSRRRDHFASALGGLAEAGKG